MTQIWEERVVYTSGNGATGLESARSHNRARVLKLVLGDPGIDRTRLATATGLTNAAVTRIVQELIQADILQDTDATEQGAGRGRRRQGLRINGAGGYVVGLSILAFNSSVVLADLTGRIVAKAAVEPVDVTDPQRTLDDLAASARRLMLENGASVRRVFGAGIAVAGYLDQATGALRAAPYLGWPIFDLRRSLQRRLRMPIAAENVNRAIAMAEVQLGSCQGASDLVLIRAALGLGGALISAGEIVRGSANAAGQIGHIPVNPESGLRCSCGARGCLNTFASGWAVLHRMGLSDHPLRNQNMLESHERQLKNILAAERAGKKDAIDALGAAGEALGRHCVGLLSALEPQAVILTGPLGRSEAYCSSFAQVLAGSRLTARLVTGRETSIVSGGLAASTLALSNHVYSPSFDLRPLLQDPEIEMAGAEVI